MSVSELISDKNHATLIASKKAVGVNDRRYRCELQLKTKEFASPFLPLKAPCVKGKV